MPPVSGDFLEPKGEIDADLFPKDSASTLTARITQYIADAGVVVDDVDVELTPAEIDAAIAELVYVRLYDAILLRFANTPNTSIADVGGVSITSGQIAIIEGKRDQHQLAYDAVLEGAVVPPPSGGHETTAAPVIFGF